MHPTASRVKLDAFLDRFVCAPMVQAAIKRANDAIALVFPFV
jgi:hypothetical protein